MGRLYAYQDKLPQIAASALLLDSAEVTGDVVIGPGAMIHGCRIEAGTVVEPAAIICDYSRVRAGSLVRAGACVKQRASFPAQSVLDGFPAEVVDTLQGPPERPSWALTRQALGTLVRL
jgi:carbonic anhydrase/acetyltransferase-like protein (isoleucine patch superfamily)